MVACKRLSSDDNTLVLPSFNLIDTVYNKAIDVVIKSLFWFESKRTLLSLLYCTIHYNSCRCTYLLLIRWLLMPVELDKKELNHYLLHWCTIWLMMILSTNMAFAPVDISIVCSFKGMRRSTCDIYDENIRSSIVILWRI